eukprot:NODE_1321_length_1176_cov_328.254237.p1 GENE.NODE_1321_length_1176_cov_328.254237~~NODE_1321_length_1176_cov_328.254237.p1  ORF type:complete len:308 (+),score=59.71 NODE_1321_length_1176_cov_328.254237:3-926(+)
MGLTSRIVSWLFAKQERWQPDAHEQRTLASFRVTFFDVVQARQACDFMVTTCVLPDIAAGAEAANDATSAGEVAGEEARVAMSTAAANAPKGAGNADGDEATPDAGASGAGDCSCLPTNLERTVTRRLAGRGVAPLIFGGGGLTVRNLKRGSKQNPGHGVIALLDPPASLAAANVGEGTGEATYELHIYNEDHGQCANLQRFAISRFTTLHRVRPDETPSCVVNCYFSDANLGEAFLRDLRVRQRLMVAQAELNRVLRLRAFFRSVFCYLRSIGLVVGLLWLLAMARRKRRGGMLLMWRAGTQALRR